MPSENESLIIKEIARRYGSVIDIEKEPSVFAEILHNYGRRFAESRPFADDSTGGGSVGSGTGVSGGVQAGQTTGKGIRRYEEVRMSDMMRETLRLRRAVADIDTNLKRIIRNKDLDANRRIGKAKTKRKST